MTTGIGGATAETALAALENHTGDVTRIGADTFKRRLASLQESMRAAGGGAVYLHPGTNLFYFTGLRWNPSERMVAAVVPAEGELQYISPKFEIDTLRDHWQIPADIQTWEEHESPYGLLAKMLTQCGVGKQLFVDDVTPFLFSASIREALADWKIEEARRLTVPLRSIKSAAELALIERAHAMTLEVHQAAASILKPGISTDEVVAFIDQAHRRVGSDSGSTFCIVLFGVATSFPHGVKNPQILKSGDWVLVDTGCLLDGYHSDITRSYCFGEPTDRQRHAWDTERRAQIAAFEAAVVGQPCEGCDNAAREVLEQAGFGPDYQLPGLPHRTGHGCGLDIHEPPFLVRGESMPLQPGMVFSSEPMLVLPDEFGVRLEDHFVVTETGPRWMTNPAPSIDDPFGLGGTV